MDGENTEGTVAKEASTSEAPVILTEQEKAEKLKRAEERIKQRRLEIQEEERKREIDREKARRKDGQDLGKVKADMEWREAQKIAAQKKKEKREDRLARQKVLEEIARDRAAMKAKNASCDAGSQNPGNNTPQKSEQISPNPTPAKKDYNEAKIQIRLPSNTRLVHSFGAEEPLSAVRLYVDMNSEGELGPYIDLSTTYPRKVFTDDEMQMSLRSLGLVPTAVLQATKSKIAGSAI